MSCLCILEINPLSGTSFANIFSCSVDCLFTLFMVSFAVQKLLSLIRPHLYIFAFVSITLGNRSKKNNAAFMSESVLPIFSSRSFMLFSFIFTSFLHFQFIFIFGVRECSNFTFLNRWLFSFEEIVFFHCIFSPPLW